ncbi:cell division control protein 6 homolog B-like protein, partial [Tanacetum coccineum]
MWQAYGCVFLSLLYGSDHNGSQTTVDALPYTVFQPQALELYARKVSASSGDMRKALGICRGAIEMLETELRENACTSNLASMVRVDHMAIALSRAYKSPI